MIKTAIIAGIFTLIGSVASALINRYGLTFWKRAKRIEINGELKVLRRFDNDDIHDVQNRIHKSLKKGCY